MRLLLAAAFLILTGCERPPVPFVEIEEEGPFLVVRAFNDGGHARAKDEYLFSDMASCLRAADHTKTDGARGGDAEAVVMVYCIERRKLRIRNPKW